MTSLQMQCKKKTWLHFIHKYNLVSCCAAEPSQKILKWMPVTPTTLDVSELATELCTAPWALSSAVPIPSLYAFSYGVNAGNVDARLLCQGQVNEGIVHQCLAIMQQRLHDIPDNLPKTLVLEDSFLNQLYRTHRKAHKRASLPECPAGTFSFEHAWKSLTATSKIRPRRPSPQALQMSEVLGFDNIVIPFYNNHHFMMIHVNIQCNIISMIDSLLQSHTEGRREALQHVASFMSALEMIVNGKSHKWTCVIPTSQCQQSDGESCGIFCIAYVAQIMSGLNSCAFFRQEHVQNLRANLMEMFVLQFPHSTS